MRKRKYMALLLAVCMMLSACGPRKNGPQEELPNMEIETAPGTISTEGKEGSVIFEGGEIIPEATYRNGSKYEPYGDSDSYTFPTATGIGECTFRLPEDEVSSKIQGDGYQTWLMNQGLCITAGHLENRDQLMDTATDLLKQMDFDTQVEVKDEYTYQGNDRFFHVAEVICQYPPESKKMDRWAYIAGTEIDDSTFLYWVVEETGNQHELYGRDFENILLTVEVAE